MMSLFKKLFGKYVSDSEPSEKLRELADRWIKNQEATSLGKTFVIGSPDATASATSSVPSELLSQLDNIHDFASLKASLCDRHAVASAFLSVPAVLDLLKTRLRLTEKQQELACALAYVAIYQSHTTAGRTEIAVTSAVADLLGSRKGAEIDRRANELIDEEANRTADTIKTFLVDDPDSGMVWLMDVPEQISNAPRSVIFNDGVSSKEHQRGYMAALYGLDSSDISFAIENGPTRLGERPELARKVQKARLMLASGQFPEPATFGESRGKKATGDGQETVSPHRRRHRRGD